MHCLYCGGTTKVVNSRKQGLTSVWRRRQCNKCRAIFTTTEKVDLTSSVLVRNNRGHLQPFSRDLLMLSIYDSLRHRKTATNDSTHLVETIWKKLLPLIKAAVLDKSIITTKTYETLKKFDAVAATHYKAFHKL